MNLKVSDDEGDVDGVTEDSGLSSGERYLEEGGFCCGVEDASAAFAKDESADSRVGERDSYEGLVPG